MAAADDDLVALNDRLEESKEARGVRGGLGRVKGAQQTPWGQGFFLSAKAKWEPAGSDPLYKRFTRGPVLGEAKADADIWRRHAEVALTEAGGEMTWQELRDEVVARRRKDFAEGDQVDTSLWPFMALAHLPEKFLSEEDAMVRLGGEPQ
mmetsp:Transcript_64266/g.150678  ORF Transcript_64266/g.150678 Transcript_64266/m.150678 type:complete len:150 (+) Transcript_64266:84-533(+)|eukprot:s508_g26.t1